LVNAADAGDVEACVKVVKSGTSVNATDSSGRTALHWAVDRRHLEVVKKLIDLGANVNQLDGNHATPLMYTAISLNWKGHSASTQAVRNDIAKVLIEHGADVKHATPTGNTALHLAVGDRNPELIRLLLVAGADRTAKTAYGHTALDMARFPAYAPNDAVIDAINQSPQPTTTK
jgi:ankyrin repeat protein